MMSLVYQRNRYFPNLIPISPTKKARRVESEEKGNHSHATATHALSQKRRHLRRARKEGIPSTAQVLEMS